MFMLELACWDRGQVWGQALMWVLFIEGQCCPHVILGIGKWRGWNRQPLSSDALTSFSLWDCLNIISCKNVKRWWFFSHSLLSTLQYDSFVCCFSFVYVSVHLVYNKALQGKTQSEFWSVYELLLVLCWISAMDCNKLNYSRRVSIFISVTDPGL